MKQIKVNPNNEMYYSEDFIKGFNEGAKRQFEADLADRKTEQTEPSDWKDQMWNEAVEAEQTEPQTDYSKCYSCNKFYDCTADCEAERSDLISRCELFNRLATLPAPAEANDFKAEVYKIILSMETAPDENKKSEPDLTDCSWR